MKCKSDLEPLNEDAYYIQSCAHAKLKNYQGAYDTLKLLMVQVEEPCSDAFRLFGCVAVNMSPKLFMEAKESFDVLVKRDNSDYDAVRHVLLCYQVLLMCCVVVSVNATSMLQ